MPKLLLLLALIPITCANSEPQLVAVVRAAWSRNVIVKVGTLGICSGVVIETGRVLTAAHCVAPDQTILIDDQPSKLEKINVEADLAIFSTKTGVYPRLSVDTAPSPIAEIFIIGNAGTSRIGLIRHGRISFVKPEFFDVGANTAPGMSGGGCWGADGRLVGLHVSRHVMKSKDEIVPVSATCVGWKPVSKFLNEGID